MVSEIRHRPSFAILDVSLDRGESIRTEAGSMVGHSGDIEVETRAEGGLLKSLSRSILGGESFFMNTYTAAEPGSVSLAPALPGDVERHDLDGGLYVQSSSYLAADPSIEPGEDHVVAFEDSLSFPVRRVGGPKSTLFSGEGLVREFSGEGRLWTGSRSTDALLAWLIPKLPTSSDGN